MKKFRITKVYEDFYSLEFEAENLEAAKQWLINENPYLEQEDKPYLKQSYINELDEDDDVIGDDIEYKY